MIATRYEGNVGTTQSLFTVSAGKIVKVLFRHGSNNSSNLGSYDDGYLAVNQKMIAGTKNDSVETNPYDGLKLDINDDGNGSVIYVSGSAPLIMIAGESMGIVATGGGRFKYDMIVLEETL